MTRKKMYNFAVVVLLFLAMCAVQLAAQEGKRVVLEMSTFTVEYDTALLVPVAVEWLLFGSHLGKVKRPSSSRFREDTRVPRPRATHDDYTRSGFDRGHMCPAADRSSSRQAMDETFIMTNVTPQAPALNRGAWKRLEDGARSFVRGGHAIRIHVDCVWWQADTQRIGTHGVAVPHGFVKTIRDYPSDSIIFSKYFPNL